jgi:hypothetical protein
MSFTFYTISMGCGTGSALITKGVTAKAILLAAKESKSENTNKASEFIFDANKADA